MTRTSKRFAIAVSSIMITAMISSAASAYVLLSPARRWFPPANTPRLVHVDNGGLSSVNDSSSGVNAALNAITAWNSNGVNVTSSQSGNVSYTLGDGVSDLIFADPLHICTGSCIAATTTGYYNTGSTGTCGGLSVVEITDSDVAFNLSFNYTTVAETQAEGGCSNEIYLESVTTHEVGHVIGLAHSQQSSALMAPTVAYCDNKQLNSDDISGRNALYNCTFSGGGGGGCRSAGQSCTSNSQCCSLSCKGRPGGKTCK
jgi:matrixin